MLLRPLSTFLFLLLINLPPHAYCSELQQLLTPLLSAYPQQSGAYVLEKGEEALLARAWLADRAEQSIEVQYFIWSNDNIGTLATESLLRAAERGVQVRVLVDDLMIDAPDDFLLALAAHPKIDICIYNPQHKVGTSKPKRVLNIFTNFRGINQRMHDKTFIVDGQVCITGGRNMADEYFDYDQKYNFRDRDILLIGPVAGEIQTSFEKFWQNELAHPVEKLLKDSTQPGPKRIKEIYRELHDYALDKDNFAPEVKQALADLPDKFKYLIDNLVWDQPAFISDVPGKNSGKQGLGGGGRTTGELADALRGAQKRITIQSPYLVLPEGGLELFRELISCGVQVRISTNSLLSTDNLQAFSGYSKQRKDLFEAGIEIFEFKPQPAIQKELIERYAKLEKQAPIFAIHAKTLVIDGKQLYIGTFNLDPRSANLNTEVGVIIDNMQLAGIVEKQIERDIQPENSWHSATETPDRRAPLWKRIKLGFWKLLPLEKLL
ncbi:Phosphatidylserine/phosphatidylglycerophosphate/cardiolipin synthase [Malonomonas rubra DSM 5091]|uniref:Phosphatidylserine/phosphatidylglycerophosphate/cardiolipin synthase n=1 Tax=Malonomonas rubra DSM 5091 TaxID=1122189 RepID=A0A1M6CIB0_MALRU|nr:phospholipase D family protein [Malonomonas rubra]SHI60762.1 Phosphatidylserine/phosphatidylglycerophosphate/cardiolipin synthase [Malonomonas rubra DSM 5091]